MQTKQEENQPIVDKPTLSWWDSFFSMWSESDPIAVADTSRKPTNYGGTDSGPSTANQAFRSPGRR